MFSVTKDTGSFKVTVVDVPDDKTGEELARNTKPVGEGGAIKFDIAHRVRAVYGRQLGVSDANGGYAYVALPREAIVPDRGQGVPRRRPGRSRRHAFPAIARFHLSGGRDGILRQTVVAGAPASERS